MNCPYCDHEIDACYDEGIEEDCIYEIECDACEKTFVYTASIYYHFSASKADCLNGDDCKYEKVVHYPNTFPDWQRCKDCGHEINKYKK